MAAYTTIDDPSAYFQTAIYTGNGGTIDVVNDGNSDLQPDWLWFKCRSHNTDHGLQDSVRGNSLALQSNSSGADGDVGTSQITAIGSDGFSLASGGDVNTNSRTYVCWQWKAGTSFTNDASSTSIGATDSAGSVNDTAGFSICTYTGVGGTSTTIKHGLSTAPTLMLIKNRDQGDDWAVYHQGIGNTHRLYLNNTDAATDAIGTFRDTSPTTAIFTVGDHASVNISGEKYVAYIFAEKQGYSKFGSYTGNGNADGAFVFTGFKPAFVLIKITDNGSQDWFILDSKRSPSNLVDDSIAPNQADVEYTSEANLDFLSNGFKLRMTSIRVNASGNNYIYMAFAENPFTTSTGIPTPAR
jgi:hypothetical protein